MPSARKGSLHESFVGKERKTCYTQGIHMSATIKVIDPDFGSLQVDRVFVDAAGKLHASVSGVECSVETKEDLVQRA